ncbi:MAG: hypothetical protein ACRBI6_00380 [Acidimicrobiales bacterium]
MALAELPLMLDAARRRMDRPAARPASPIQVSLEDLPHRVLADLLAEEERLSHRAAGTVLPAADAVRLDAVTAEIDARWQTCLGHCFGG